MLVCVNRVHTGFSNSSLHLIQQGHSFCKPTSRLQTLFLH